MHSIYPALTSTDSSQGIKNINVFYDTMFINFKAYDADTLENIEYILIEKLKFDYNQNLIKSFSNGSIISFGDTRTALPFKSLGNTFIDNILLEDSKTVLVCGLSATTDTITVNVGSETVSGTSFVPIIYRYDINDDVLKKLYPQTNNLSCWSNVVLGNYVSGQTPLVSFNSDTNNINFIVKSQIQVVSPSARSIDVINDIMFEYNFVDVSLSNVRQLTAINVDNNFIDYDYIKMRNYGDNKKIIVSHKEQTAQVFTLL